MDEKMREEVALFRFGVISDLVCSRFNPGEISIRIREKSEQSWRIPHSGRTRVSESTIRRWVTLYQNSGGQLASLYPRPRSDRGRSRRVDEETVLSLVKLRKEMPGIPVDNRLFEAPTKFIGEQLSLLYHEYKPERVEIMHKGRSHGLLVPLDLKVNSEVRRDKPIQGKLPFETMEDSHEL